MNRDKPAYQRPVSRRTAGVVAAVTGTRDKFFPEGLENSPFWPRSLDVCSIHYQGMSAPVLHPEWHNRKHHKGRVLIRDTES